LTETVNFATLFDSYAQNIMNQHVKKFAVLAIVLTAALTVAPVLAQDQFPYLDPSALPPVRTQSASRFCDTSAIQYGAGFYGQYYNLAMDDPGMLKGQKITPIDGRDHYWYTTANLSLEKVDTDLNFGNRFLPLNEGKNGDPFYFAVHWRAAVYIPENGTYSFSMTSDDDSWLFINDQIVIDIAGVHPARTKKGSVQLNAGLYETSIFYAERATNGAAFTFKSEQNLLFSPLPPNCTLQNLGYSPSRTSPSNMPRGRVLGVETTAYTPAIALYRAAGSPDIYAIYANGQRHYVSGPTAFLRYGYKFNQVKTVSRATLDKYPDAQLLRTPDNPTVYFISARSNNQWLKITLNSPTVFVSYPNNSWGDIIVVDELDIRAYPNVRLIHSATDSNVYLLEGNARRPFVSREIMERLGYNANEIMEISEAHLKSFLLGELIG